MDSSCSCTAAVCGAENTLLSKAPILPCVSCSITCPGHWFFFLFFFFLAFSGDIFLTTEKATLLSLEIRVFKSEWPQQLNLWFYIKSVNPKRKKTNSPASGYSSSNQVLFLDADHLLRNLWNVEVLFRTSTPSTLDPTWWGNLILTLFNQSLKMKRNRSHKHKPHFF